MSRYSSQPPTILTFMYRLLVLAAVSLIFVRAYYSHDQSQVNISNTLNEAATSQKSFNNISDSPVSNSSHTELPLKPNIANVLIEEGHVYQWLDSNGTVVYGDANSARKISTGVGRVKHEPNYISDKPHQLGSE